MIFVFFFYNTLVYNRHAGGKFEMLLIVSRGWRTGWRDGLLTLLTFAERVAGWQVLLLTGALLGQGVIRGP